eukprot:6263992-Prymnesium_polylepis.1
MGRIHGIILQGLNRSTGPTFSPLHIEYTFPPSPCPTGVYSHATQGTHTTNNNESCINIFRPMVVDLICSSAGQGDIDELQS